MSLVLVIDNYDSFTYNLVQAFQTLQQEVIVYYNDQITLANIAALQPDYIVISPGPNNPDQAGISLAVIANYYDSIPILGVCLGHQCLAQAFGAQITTANQIMHGKTSLILHNQQRLFRKIPNYFTATRYHSLAVDINTLPTCFTIDAWADQTIMAISHRTYPLYGVQFHPEAILTEHGINIMDNFIHTVL